MVTNEKLDEPKKKKKKKQGTTEEATKKTPMAYAHTVVKNNRLDWRFAHANHVDAIRVT